MDSLLTSYRWSHFSKELLFGVMSSSVICIPQLECWGWRCPIPALRHAERGLSLCPVCLPSSLWDWWGGRSVEGGDRRTGWLFEASVICKFAIIFKLELQWGVAGLACFQKSKGKWKCSFHFRALWYERVFCF